MYALPHQVDYLSDAWLGEAERYLQRELTAGRPAVVRPFSLSQRATDSPPHLGFADGVTDWNARFDGERLAVARADDPDAEALQPWHLTGAAGAVDGGTANGTAG